MRQREKCTFSIGKHNKNGEKMNSCNQVRQSPTERCNKVLAICYIRLEDVNSNGDYGYNDSKYAINIDYVPGYYFI